MSKVKTEKSQTETSLKKNTSAYMSFCKEERQKVKEDLPELNNKEIVTELGRRWKELPQLNPNRLQRLKDEALKDQERYKKEKADFQTSLKNNKTQETETEGEVKVKVETEKKKKTKKATVAQTVTPVVEEVQKKTKVNGYLNFAKSQRSVVKSANPSLSPQDVTKEIGKLWNALSDSEKETYKH